jgi:serine/threonine protein kinase
MHSIRVNVASVSQSVVYYVTPPIGKTVNAKEKLYAFKLMSDKSLFEREVEKLNRIKLVWENDISNQDFYYVGNSDSFFQTQGMIATNASKRYAWLATTSNQDYSYHIIIMRPALRTKLCDVVDTTGKVYSELLRSLAIAHKAGVLHCDLSPNNCLQFTYGWQVVDYGLSIDIEVKEDWMTSYSGRVSIQKGSYQHRCCGDRAFEIISGSEHRVIEFDWTVADDLEMLQRACSRQNR